MSFGDVSAAFFAHLSDVHTSKSMSFKKASSPVKTLTNYYIIGKPAGKTSCYIISHGGNLRSSYHFSNMDFTVPKGVTLLFFHDHGDLFSYSYNNFSSGDAGDLPMVKVSDGKKVYQAGEACQNYILNKFHGRHGANENYEDLQDLAAPGNHLFVVVRNRWFHTGATLQNLIGAVRAEYPAITQFNCMFCREVEGTDTWFSATSRAVKTKQIDGSWA